MAKGILRGVFFATWRVRETTHEIIVPIGQRKEPLRRISEALKVAATSSPTIFRSAVPSAMLSLCPCLSLCPVPSPLSAPLSPASARSAALRSLSRAPLRPPPPVPRASVRNGLSFSNPFQLNTTHTNPFQRLSTQIPSLPTLTTLINQPEKENGSFYFLLMGSSLIRCSLWSRSKH